MTATVARRITSCAAQALAVTGAVTALGRVVEGPLQGFPAEGALNRWCVAHRSPLRNRLTWAPSTYADTPATIGMSLLLGAALWRSTGSAREAGAPLAAIALETACFVAASHVVGRARPDVVWLDRPAPTPSFPSGHTGATTAMHLVVARALRRSGRPGAARALSVALPVSVGVSRVYRGMHHPSDVVVGVALGAWAARAVGRLLDLEG